MTDKTQPEALRLANEFKLCNEYDSIPSITDIAKAEAELRRQHARIAELEAELEAVGAGGVQALSAAPAEVMKWPKDASEVREFMHTHCITEQYAVGIESPSDDDKYLLSAHDFLSAVNWWADFPHYQEASPTPRATPAEQQAKDSYIKLLADCRDAFPVPEHGSPIENEWIAAVGSHEAVPAYLQAVAKQQAITPETGNSVSAQGAAITSESGAVYAELCCDEVSRAVDVVVERCISLTQDATGIKLVYDPIILANALRTELRGFADRTHALRMEQAATKAAPVVWLSSKQLRGVTALHGQYLPFRCQPEGRFDTPVYLVEAAPKTAPQQEAQEPATVPYQKLTNEIDLILTDPNTVLSFGARRALHWMRTWVSVPLFTAPQPAPAPLSDDTKRLNWLLWKLPGDALRYVVGELSDTSSGAEFRAAIDAALAAQGGKA